MISTKTWNIQRMCHIHQCSKIFIKYESSLLAPYKIKVKTYISSTESPLSISTGSPNPKYHQAFVCTTLTAKLKKEKSFRWIGENINQLDFIALFIFTNNVTACALQNKSNKINISHPNWRLEQSKINRDWGNTWRNHKYEDAWHGGAMVCTVVSP